MNMNPQFYLNHLLGEDDELSQITHDFLVDELIDNLKAVKGNLQAEKRKVLVKKNTADSIEFDLYTNTEDVSIAYECRLSDIGTGELIQVLQYMNRFRLYGPVVDALVFVGLSINPAVEMMFENINNRNRLKGIKTRILLRTWSDYDINLLDDAALGIPPY